MKVEEMSSSQMERIVTERMLELGVPAHLKGYHYLREAIVLTAFDMDMVSSVTKVLYPAVGRKFVVEGGRVERAIRNAIEVAWERGDTKRFQVLFAYSKETGCARPTNSEFIARIADQIRLDFI
ncbi:MAG: sporulation initiation factor Spo0A C-terminal domain-containing protein [Eubacteriales bacterium]